ncbi:MAG: histidinol phosphate phosphatase [Sulfurospirillum sp.]|nr:MAG: histidinol phosphate phosphatase [Sulfurospirillum sp.]
MRVDLHNHTTLCNHAEGEMYQYIEKAIASGTEYFGFSEHAPMAFDERYRMRFDQMEQYREDVLGLRKAYADRIEILLGLEVDFLPGYMDDRVLNADVDYLIGSVHFIGKWGFDNPEFIGEYQNRDIDQIWQEYFDAVTAMAKSGYFDIVGHIDLIKVFKYLPKKDIRLIAAEALEAIKKADMTIEINMAGYRKPVAEPYPSPLLLDEIRQRDIPVTFGSDAHKPQQVSLYAKEVVTLAKAHGFDKCAVFKERERELLNI